MQTQFKWTDKQRLLIIDAMGMGISMTNDIEKAKTMGLDISMFAAANSDFLNTNEYVQKKLTFVFNLSKTLGTTEMHDELLRLENESEEISLTS